MIDRRTVLVAFLAGAAELSADCLDAFDTLLAKYELCAPVVDTAQVRRRLDIVHTRALLDELLQY